MFRKLRWTLIGIMMSLLAVVLVAVLLVFNITSYSSELDSIRNALSYATHAGPQGNNLPSVGGFMDDQGNLFDDISDVVSFERESTSLSDGSTTITTTTTTTTTVTNTDDDYDDDAVDDDEWGYVQLDNNADGQQQDARTGTMQPDGNGSASANPQNQDQQPPAFPEGTSGANDHGPDPSIPVYCVLVDDQGNVETLSSNTSMDSTLLQAAIKAVQVERAEFGELSDLGLFYSVGGYDNQTAIAFAASSTFYDNFTTRLLNSLIIGIATLAALLLVSMLLSKLALRPVEEAWRGQQRFIADASHELKTPLTVILANNDIVTAHPDQTIQSQMRWLEGTREEASKMQGLVQDLLTLAQTEPDAVAASRAKVELDTVDFSGLVEMDVLQFEAVAFEKGVELADDVEENLSVKADEGKLERVVRVLLDNACKYVKQKDPEQMAAVDADGDTSVDVVRVSLHREKSQVVLRVNNGGKPISPDDLPHVFDRFYRSDKARGGEVEGYGLGLPIAKNIVTGFGGTISVDSNSHDGTTFTVRLPLA